MGADSEQWSGRNKRNPNYQTRLILLSEDDLKSTYGLTVGESRLALRLLAGASLREAAQGLGITYETARTKLKFIFRKTGTHRQAELVLLLAGAQRQPPGKSKR